MKKPDTESAERDNNPTQWTRRARGVFENVGLGEWIVFELLQLYDDGRWLALDLNWGKEFFLSPLDIEAATYINHRPLEFDEEDDE